MINVLPMQFKSGIVYEKHENIINLLRLQFKSGIVYESPVVQFHGHFFGWLQDSVELYPPAA